MAGTRTRGRRVLVALGILVAVVLLGASALALQRAGPAGGAASDPGATQDGAAQDDAGAGSAGAGGAPVVVAVGDVACPPDEPVEDDSCQHAATAEAAASVDPDAVLALGDLQYPDGELEDFEASYDPTWGRLKDVTHPVIGNHEMRDDDGDGYYAYFGAAAGDRDAPWRSFEVGEWHVVALDSECGGCLDDDSEQLEWLREDLAASDARCTLAYAHRPRFASDGNHGDEDSMEAVWEVLDAAGADVVLGAHAHYYERTAPLTADGVEDEQGLTSFVVGTGGDSFHGLDDPDEATQVRQNDTFGVLALTLHPDRYDWEFVPVEGGDFEDAGTAACASA
ncbi:metallophosphoesterase [Quadrisphaera sp. DSM 44207]|uniref:metallophosphoesterase family protein n=1 Tax=Quadrisphaera sp. DSM 44207 TaxID=1881057 RepID=UPI00087FD7F1|nr:metallophosphoesterase [Quadrisphaera sp. DSM 44207]SDQ10847.1 Calcineurin-like phosphoesterase [Quadrisphaera sp. DSM 44207]